jgi:hypothetical protein
MRATGKWMMLPAVVFLAACGRQDVPAPDKLDDLGWLDELTFPASAGTTSPLELGLLPEPAFEEPAAEAPRPAARSAAPRAATQPRASSAPGPYSRPAPAPAPARRNTTKRDAAIGAGAGAVIGATVAGSGKRVRGAVVGGAAGAVIGGVIGHERSKPRFH